MSEASPGDEFLRMTAEFEPQPLEVANRLTLAYQHLDESVHNDTSEHSELETIVVSYVQQEQPQTAELKRHQHDSIYIKQTGTHSREMSVTDYFTRTSSIDLLKMTQMAYIIEDVTTVIHTGDAQVEVR